MTASPLFLESLALLGATALGLAIFAIAIAALWRAMSDERPLLLSGLLSFEGIEMGEHVSGAGAHQFALAARKCMQCGARGQCEAWLAGRSADGYESFCPNAAYIARLKAAQHR
jgi:hypothetical protein